MPSPNSLTESQGEVTRDGIEVVRAKNLADAITHMAQGHSAGRPWTPLAGGTDLMVSINQRANLPARILDLWGVEGLRGISESEGAVHIGALTTYAAVKRSEVVANVCAPLVESSRLTGAAQIQNRGTLGGNIAGGSPAGDSLPVLAAYDADLALIGVRGSRVVAFNDFYTGYRQNLLQGDELIQQISIPKPAPGTVGIFRKVGTRKAQSISKVMLCMRGRLDDDGRVAEIAIAVGSVAPTVIRLPKTEALITGNKVDGELLKAAKAMTLSEVSPIDDVRSNAEYRRTVAGNLVARYLGELLRPPR